LNAEVTDGVSV